MRKREQEMTKVRLITLFSGIAIIATGMPTHAAAGASTFSAASAPSFDTHPQGLDPYKDFRFRIVMDGSIVAGANKMNGLTTASAGTARGNPGPWRQEMPGRQKWEPITLERGVTRDTSFESWAQAGENAAPRELTLEVMNEAGGVEASYKLHSCHVLELQAMPDLDAGAHTVSITAIKIEYNGWEQGGVPPVLSPAPVSSSNALFSAPTNATTPAPTTSRNPPGHSQ
jgi:phage tail-like protein